MDSLIRPLSAGDRDGLARLCHDHARFERADDPSEGFVDRLLARLLTPEPDVWCWLVQAEGALVGYMTCSREFAFRDAGDYLHMDCLYLDPQFRGRGIGKALIAQAVTKARELGIPVVRWQTPMWNTDAIRFYEALRARGEHLVQLTVGV